MNAANIQPYSRAVVKLLKGIVEKDDVPEFGISLE